MVAGMLMSLADLRAIYELLFKDGVIVAKKDKRPQSMHPGVKVVSNLKVICAMGSLRSKGCVRETFAWKHAYYYLTNKGIAYLRDYLHLPPEIMPAPLQGVHCSASSAQVQTVKGHSSYIPKSNPGKESQAAMMGKHVYHCEKVGEESEQSARPPKSKSSDSHRTSVDQVGVQNIMFFKRCKDWAKEGHRDSSGAPVLPAEDRATTCPVSVMETKLPASLVATPPSLVPKIPKEMSTIQMTSCTPLKKELQKLLKVTVAQQPAASEESERVKTREPTDKFIPDVARRETLNPAWEVLGEVVKPGEHAVSDQQTVPLVAKFTEQEEQGGALERADGVTENTVEKLSCVVKLVKQLSLTPQFDPGPATPPSAAVDNFGDLTGGKVVGIDVGDTEKTISTQAFSQFHVGSETSSIAPLEADCLIPVDLSEGAAVALNISLLPGDWGFCAEDPETDVQRIWPDFLEGLSYS